MGSLKIRTFLLLVAIIHLFICARGAEEETDTTVRELELEEELATTTVRNRVGVEEITLEEHEGEACDGDETLGRCVAPHHCFSTNPYIEGIVYPLNCTLSDGSRGVCCTDCKLVANASDAVLDGRGSMFWKTGQKSFDKCLEWLQQLTYLCSYHSWLIRHLGDDTQGKCHIYWRMGVAPVGGVDVRRGEFPHMALLGYRDSIEPTDWLCSGALVSERFVLTAAHCLNSSLGPVSEVAVGLLKRSDPEEYWNRYRVARAIPHPEYKPLHKYHDIALLQTELPVQFVRDVRPACLPVNLKPYDYEERSSSITATGWGALGRRSGLADHMQKVGLELYSEAECKMLYPPNRHMSNGIDNNTQMCFGHHTLIRDTCGGDSGGPLQSDTSKPSCVSTILGVTSFGRQCGSAPTAGVYIRVEAYLPWIESIVWQET